MPSGLTPRVVSVPVEVEANQSPLPRTILRLIRPACLGIFPTPPGAVSPQGPRRNAHIEPVAAAVPPHAVQEQPAELANVRPAWSPASPSRPGAPIARSFPASMARLAGRDRRSRHARFGNAGCPTTFMDAGWSADAGLYSPSHSKRQRRRRRSHPERIFLPARREREIFARQLFVGPGVTT